MNRIIARKIAWTADERGDLRRWTHHLDLQSQPYLAYETEQYRIVSNAAKRSSAYDERMSHMKPRSGLVTDGLERAPARGMLRAIGMGDEDWVKPQIGIASSWNEITPCNLSLDRLAKASRQGVIDAGGFPMQFGTISVSDGISMGHEGMHFSLVSREVIADSVETVMQAERQIGRAHV